MPVSYDYGRSRRTRQIWSFILFSWKLVSLSSELYPHLFVAVVYYAVKIPPHIHKLWICLSFSNSHVLWCLHYPVAMTSAAQCGSSALSHLNFKSTTFWLCVATIRNNKWSFQFPCLCTEAFPMLNKESNCFTHYVRLNPIVLRK